MSKTKILGILIIVGALIGAGIQYLQGKAVDFRAVLEGVSAGFGLIFVRSGIDKAIVAAKSAGTK